MTIEEACKFVDISNSSTLERLLVKSYREAQAKIKELEDDGNNWEKMCRESDDMLKKINGGIGFMKAKIVALESCLEKKDENFQCIKNLVCGERSPRWTDDWTTTHSRGRIADICDFSIALKP